jgi:hypothetical protein
LQSPFLQQWAPSLLFWHASPEQLSVQHSVESQQAPGTMIGVAAGAAHALLVQTLEQHSPLPMPMLLSQ